MINKFHLGFILHAKNSSPKKISNSFAEFGTQLSITESQDSKENDNYQVSIVTEDPTLVFDLCAQFGRIRQIKVNEIKSSK